MTSRASSELLLVGSLPGSSTDSVLRVASELFGDIVFALPDGETGPRAGWVAYERATLFKSHPDLEITPQTESPTDIPRHAYETPLLRIRDGVTELRWDRWPRIDDAMVSYELFSRLKREGVIASHLRFQVSLPFPASVLYGFRPNYAVDYPVAARGFEDLVRRELKRLLSAIPDDELAIQWDVCFEVLDLEGVLAWTSGDAWERFTGSVRRLAPLVPEDVLLGYHLCYGTFPEWPMYEARDMGLLVRMANYAVSESGREVDWIHMAGPRYLRSEDNSFFQPLSELKGCDARVYLGIVLPLDGVPGLKRRHRMASKYLTDFGVSMYCGFGRQPGIDGMQTMREHSRVVRSLRGAHMKGAD